ncbi:MAG: mechanosensitive ion channel [Chloracidobacterium sp.]|nr:mechanosensitive ion channel [Chloracidobacterium sp.]
MAATELQKKAVSVVIFSALTVLVLLSLPVVELWLQASVLPQFGMSFTKGWQLTTESATMPMHVTYANAVDATFRIFKIVLWMALVIAVVRFLAFFIIKTAYRTSKQPEVSSLVKTVSSIIIYIVAFFIVFQTQYPDVPLTPLFTGSTILGIVVGLALQETLGNLFAGLALQADQPFQVGDVISIGKGGSGVVETVSWRGVKIRTFQNKLLIISNAVLGKEFIEVAPKNNLNARAVFFNTEYTDSPTRIVHVVRDAVRQVENVTNKIRPVVRIRNLSDNGVEWEVKYWLEDYAKHNDTDALIRERIWYVFHRERIAFSAPTLIVQRGSATPEAEPQEIVNANTDHLNRVSIFAPLSDDETEQLANASYSRVYAPGEAIVRQGKEGNSMFVILRGSVRIQIPEGSYQKTIGRLGKDDFFGEMSLLTGEPRSASVIAEEETEVLQIKKDALKPIFENNPDLVKSICELIEERRELLASIEETTLEESLASHKGVMGSIKRFFGLK